MDKYSKVWVLVWKSVVYPKPTINSTPLSKYSMALPEKGHMHTNVQYVLKGCSVEHKSSTNNTRKLIMYIVILRRLCRLGWWEQ